MSVTVHVIYPITEGATFDYDYFADKHLKLVRKHFEPHGLSGATASKGLSGGPDTPPAHFAITTLSFPDDASMQAALGSAGPVIEDISNYTNCHPQMMIGTVIA